MAKISSGKKILWIIMFGIIFIVMGNSFSVSELVYSGIAMFGIALVGAILYITTTKNTLSSKKKFVGWTTLDDSFTEMTALVLSKPYVELGEAKNADFSDDERLKSILFDVNTKIDQQRRPRNEQRLNILKQFEEELEKRVKSDKEERSEIEKVESAEPEKEKKTKKAAKKDAEITELKSAIEEIKKTMERSKDRTYLTTNMFIDTVTEIVSVKDGKEIKQSVVTKKGLLSTGIENMYFYYCEMWKPWVWGNGTGYFDSFVIVTPKPWDEEFHEDEIEDDHIVGINLTICAYVADLSVIGFAQPDVPVFNVEYTVNDALTRAKKVKDYVKDRDKFIEAMKRYCSSLRAGNERSETEVEIYADDAEYWHTQQAKTHQKLKMAQNRGATEQNTEEHSNSKFVFAIAILMIIIGVMFGIIANFAW